MSDVNDYSIRAKPPDGAKTWTEEELMADGFVKLAFLAPYVLVRQIREDGPNPVGVMEFIHDPRVYFGFEEIEPGGDQVGLSFDQLREMRLAREGITSIPAFVEARRRASDGDQ